MLPVPVQPYGKSEYQTPCTDMAVGCIDLHPEFIAELGVSSIASIIPGTIIGVSFPNGDLNTGKIVEVLVTPTIATDEPEKPAPSPKDATEGDNGAMKKDFDKSSYVHCMPSQRQIAKQAKYKEEFLAMHGWESAAAFKEKSTPFLEQWATTTRSRWERTDPEGLAKEIAIYEAWYQKHPDDPDANRWHRADTDKRQRIVTDGWNDTARAKVADHPELKFDPLYGPNDAPNFKIGDSSMVAGEIDGVVYNRFGPASCVPKELATQTKEQLNASDRVEPITVAINCSESGGTARFNGETPLQPVTGRIGHGFDEQRGSSLHSGWDTGVPTGTNAYAIADGKVVGVKDSITYGKGGAFLEVEYPTDDGGRVIIRYLHLSVLPEGITKGTTVTAGEVIALTGNTGNSSDDHLHSEAFYIEPNTYETNRDGSTVLDDDGKPIEAEWSWSKRNSVGKRMDDHAMTEILGWDFEEYHAGKQHHDHDFIKGETGYSTGNARCPDNTTAGDQYAAGASGTPTTGG